MRNQFNSGGDGQNSEEGGCTCFCHVLREPALATCLLLYINPVGLNRAARRKSQLVGAEMANLKGKQRE